MKFKIWNRITAIGAVAAAIGVFLSVLKFSFGKMVLVVGAVAFVIGIIGTFYHIIKHPFCCPKCGASLASMGSSLDKKSAMNRDSTITCQNCGTRVSLSTLYQSKE